VRDLVWCFAFGLPLMIGDIASDRAALCGSTASNT